MSTRPNRWKIECRIKLSALQRNFNICANFMFHKKSDQHRTFLNFTLLSEQWRWMMHSAPKTYPSSKSFLSLNKRTGCKRPSKALKYFSSKYESMLCIVLRHKSPFWYLYLYFSSTYDPPLLNGWKVCGHLSSNYRQKCINVTRVILMTNVRKINVFGNELFLFVITW